MVALVLACSGGSDVGEIADRTARTLAKSGTAKMYCLAGIGGKLPSMVKFAGEADQILAIDGCPQHCAAHCLHNAGIEKFRHLRLAELGLEKGKSPATAKMIEKVTAAAQKYFDEGVEA